MNHYGSAYIKWFLHHNRKRLWTFLGVLLILFILPACMVEYDSYNEIMPMEWATILLMAGNMGLAMFLPIYLFQYLWKKRSCDLFLPLPMPKRQLFLIHYGLGLCLLGFPVLMFLIACGLREESRAFFPYLALFAFGLYIITLCTYSLYVFAVVKCNSLWDALIAVLSYALLQVLLAPMIEWMLSNVVEEVLVGGSSVTEFFPMRHIETLLSPILACAHWLDNLSAAFYAQKESIHTLPLWENLFALDVKPLLFLALIAFGAVACVGAMVSYEHRKGEDSEQKTTSKWIYPLLIYAITGCMLIATAMSASTLWITLIVFFVLNFAAERKITLRFSKIAGFVGMMFCAIALFWVLVMTQGFHLIHEYYAANQIQDVSFFLNLYDGYDKLLMIEKEESDGDWLGNLKEGLKDEHFITMIVAFQHDLAEYEGYDTSIGYIQIHYTLRNGESAFRSYIIYEPQIDSLKAILTYLQETGTDLFAAED